MDTEQIRGIMDKYRNSQNRTIAVPTSVQNGAVPIADEDWSMQMTKGQNFNTDGFNMTLNQMVDLKAQLARTTQFKKQMWD